MDINKHEGDNLGGINSFKYTFIENISEIPETYNGAIHHAVELLPGTRWFDGYCTEGTMNYKEPQEDSNHGGSHNKEFSGIVPKDRAELVDTFEAIKNRKCILDIFDNNGQRRLVGTKEEPMYVNTAYDSKNDVPGKNGYMIVFKGSGVKRSPVYKI